MNASSLLKKALFIIALSLSVNFVKAQSNDTTTYYYRNLRSITVLVSSLDSADFVRVIPPFRLTDERVEVKDFYKNGKMKFVGTAIPSTVRLEKGTMKMEGQGISFFDNGKRKSITTYKENQKQGTEYNYYPNGSPYQIIKYKNISGSIYTTALLESFFDKTGKEICANGEGTAYDYDDDFNIVRWGTIHHGLMNGEWRGYITGKDSAKYSITYKDDKYSSGIGYDTLGKEHPFKDISEDAEPKGGRFVFIEMFKKLVSQTYKIPHSKIFLDSARISFTIKEDGSLVNLEPLSTIQPELVEAMRIALSQCPKWSPATTYGIPLKAVFSLSLFISEQTRGQLKFKQNEGFQVKYYNGTPLDAEGNYSIRL
jgi:antitoxin component YwqK of YwqJK toxin-antitoxin module